MVFTEGRLTLLSRRAQPQLTSPPANCQSQDLILPSPPFAPILCVLQINPRPIP